jgi:CubicO group peptidase (beta-lactamase class C family)
MIGAGLLRFGVLTGFAASSVMVNAQADIEIASQVPSPYRGAPRTYTEYAHGYPALIACNAYFASKEPLERILAEIIWFDEPLRSLVDKSAAGVAKHLLVNDSVRTVTFQTSVYQRTAYFSPGAGCTILPPSMTEPYVAPPSVQASDPSSAALWPEGETVATAASADFDRAKMAKALRLLFGPGSSTEALVIVKDGRIALERYGEGYNHEAMFNSYSLTKSLTATMIGVLAKKGVLSPDDKVPVSAWQGADDPRRHIRIIDLMRMSSGLSIPDDPKPWEWPAAIPPNSLLYNDAVDTAAVTFNAPYKIEPGRLGEYREQNYQALGYLIDRFARSQGKAANQLIQSELFDKLGIPKAYFAYDPYGNIQSYAFSLLRPRDWARLGLLYLNGGRWGKEQLLDKAFVDLVRTEAPAWKSDPAEEGRSYGAGFWMIPDRAEKDTLIGWAPKDSFFMLGFGYQVVLIVPSKKLVVVRFGHVWASQDELALNPATGKDEPAYLREVTPAFRLILDAIK